MLRIVKNGSLALALVCGVVTPLGYAQAQEAKLGAELERQIEKALETAKTTGLSLKERLSILQQSYDLPESIKNAGVGSLKNERVRKLLGIKDTEDDETGDGAERYPEGVFVFASFSMPGPALRQLLRDAAEMGVPVVFNGFVDNSVVKTEAVLRQFYADADQSNGFMIDPTLFTRFKIKAVPSFVTTIDTFDVCETAGCAQDPLPSHDIVKGNIPLKAALEIIAKGGGDAVEPAVNALEGKT